MLALYVDLSTISVVCDCMIEYQYAIISVNAMLVIYSWINLIEKLPIYSTNTCLIYIISIIVQVT